MSPLIALIGFVVFACTVGAFGVLPGLCVIVAFITGWLGGTYDEEERQLCLKSIDSEKR